jgi:hypothetical protein
MHIAGMCDIALFQKSATQPLDAALPEKDFKVSYLKTDVFGGVQVGLSWDVRRFP